ncbi:MAG: type I 3-dehydroquinate dehydratase [Faecalibacterium sp.]
MSCITVHGCQIGEGRPKVIIPIVERTEAAVLARAAEFSTLRADCVEWRVDWLDASADAETIQRCLKGLRAALRDKLLLITFRTQAEGGQKSLTPEQYAAFCQQVCASGCADLLDIELFPAGELISGLIEQAHAAGVRVVCSSHDFAKTPPRAELVARMVQMQRAGADLPKLAVMPHSRADVLELLAATAEMADIHPETPVITMSMGALGAVSRLCGEALGSAMTFASAGRASAPGQISLDVLNQVLDELHG